MHGRPGGRPVYNWKKGAVCWAGDVRVEICLERAFRGRVGDRTKEMRLEETRVKAKAESEAG